MSFSNFEDQLPIEIFETIIDFLAEEENSLPSIKACSLVCRNFLPITRKHFFRTLILNSVGWPGWTAERFVLLILHTSDISKYVHKLKFYIRLKDLSIKELPEILKKFTMLKHLTICQEDVWSWSDIPLPVKEALFQLFCLPTLSHLTLGPINDFVISDLLFCSNLKYLNIFPVVNFLPPKYSPPSCYVGRDEWDEWDDHLCACRNAGGMFVVDLSIYYVVNRQRGKDLQAKAKAFFTHCSQLMDIRTSKIAYGGAMTLINGLADTILPVLQTLQHLHIRANVSTEFHDVLNGLPAELDVIAGKNVIECISIFLTIEINRDFRLGHEWSKLDSALTQHRAGWPNLKNVTLKLKTRGFHSGEVDLEKAFKNLPESHLQGLARSEDIELDFDVEGNFYYPIEYDSDAETSSLSL